MDRDQHGDFGMEFWADILLPAKVPELIVVLLHGVGALLRESGGDHAVSDDSDTADLGATKIRHLCHVTGILKKLPLFGGERDVRNRIISCIYL